MTFKILTGLGLGLLAASAVQAKEQYFSYKDWNVEIQSFDTGEDFRINCTMWTGGDGPTWCCNSPPVEELDCAEFVLLSGRREYTFKAPSEDACTVLVHNLRQLCERQRAAAAAAGDAAPAPRRGLSKLFSRGSHTRSSGVAAAAGAPAESSAS